MDVTIPVTEARSSLPRVIDTARTQAVFLTRRGAIDAVVISPAHYERMQAALEDAEDAAAFDVAMSAGQPSIPWEQVKVDLGWA